MNDKRAVAIGNFDGVHRGHRLLLEELKRLAKERGLRPAAVTFTSHPLALIAPERAPAMLQKFTDRCAAITAMGIEVIPFDFDARLRRLSPADFLKYLAEHHNVRMLLLGHDTRFGYRKPGDTLLPEHSYGSEAAAVGIELQPAPVLPGISSSAIRKAIAAGEVERAGEMLGYPYTFAATVCRGRQLGRTIGYPTANLDISNPDTILPGMGVYAAIARTIAGKCFPAMVNIGRRPTVDKSENPTLSVEAFLDGFCGDLYGQSIMLQFYSMLRRERPFPSLEALRQQLAADLTNLRRCVLPFFCTAKL